MTATAVTVTAVTGLLAAALAAGEARRSSVRFTIKPAASAGFVVLALILEALDTPYGRWILVALVLSSAGDVLLLGSSAPLFLGGLVAFLLGHAAYIGAFLTAGFTWAGTLASLPVLAAVGAGVFGWLWRRLPRPMRVPVTAYIVVILSMAVLSVSAAVDGGWWLLPVAAALFVVSDLFVARNRFVASGPVNRIWGLPIYYAAQLLFAWSIPIVT